VPSHQKSRNATLAAPTPPNPPTHPQPSYDLALFDNPCLCGTAPAWFGNLSYSRWSTNTALQLGNTTCGACNATKPLPALAHPDYSALQSLKAAATYVPVGTPTGAMGTWAAGRVPCSELDPLCAPCVLTAAAATCGTAAPSDPATPTLPRWWCNYQGVTCREGRVTGLNLSWLSISFGSMPPGALAMGRIETLGGLAVWGCCATMGTGSRGSLLVC
jgi:hypothetical protein